MNSAIFAGQHYEYDMDDLAVQLRSRQELKRDVIVSVDEVMLTPDAGQVTYLDEDGTRHLATPNKTAMSQLLSLVDFPVRAWARLSRDERRTFFNREVGNLDIVRKFRTAVDPDTGKGWRNLAFQTRLR